MFDIANMFLNIDNMKGIQVVKTILANRQVKESSAECIIEGLEICICSNNSKFDQDHLLQKNDTATGPQIPAHTLILHFTDWIS